MHYGNAKMHIFFEENRTEILHLCCLITISETEASIFSWQALYIKLMNSLVVGVVSGSWQTNITVVITVDDVTIARFCFKPLDRSIWEVPAEKELVSRRVRCVYLLQDIQKVHISVTQER